MNKDPGAFPGTDRYVPIRLLGAGGMGAVYEAEDRATGGRVALKVLLSDDAGRLLRFKNEFRVMAELAHPNLVRLFDLGQHEGRWFFTMELIRGRDLQQALALKEVVDVAESTAAAAAVAAPAREPKREIETATAVGIRGPLRAPAAIAPPPSRAPRESACDPAALARAVAQILDALAFLHERGLVHRDLKPSNILADDEGVVRLCDFGLAGRVDRALSISQEGTLVGTLAYLSPEQYRGAPASPASDMYALGCLVYQLLAGELPFSGTPARLMSDRIDKPPPRLDGRVAGLPPALVEIVHRLMARDPAERPSIAEVRAALGIDGPGAPARTGAASDASIELFVGRQRELASLSGCVARAAAGEPQLALVSGPSGIGKSTLARVVTRRARSLGFLCFHGRCYQREQVPFVAFDRAMDEVVLTLRQWPESELAALRPSIRALQRLFPALAMLTGDGTSAVRAPASPASMNPRELRRQALDALVELVDRCQRRTPLCFVLDDLQWADEDSVALLEALRAGAGGRVLLLCLYRADARGEGRPLDRLLAAVEAEAERAGAVTAIALEPLLAADAMRLVEVATRGRLESQVSAALASQADGNPFLLRRLAEHLEAAAPAERTARLDAVGSAGDLLRATTRGLLPGAARVLALAAASGEDVAAPVLRAASGLPSAEFDLAISELTAARLCKAVPPAPGAGAPPRFDTYHDRIREVVYGDLPEEERRALHRSLALALEEHPIERGHDVEALVRHYRGAGDRTRLRRYAVVAAEEAAAKLAFVHAARLFRVVLDDPEPGPVEDPLAAAARWERAGDLFACGGQHHEAAHAYAEALRRWEAAPEANAERPIARIRLSGLVGAHRMATDQIAAGREVFERGLALLGLPLDRPRPRRTAVIVGLLARNALAARLAPRSTATPATPAPPTPPTPIETTDRALAAQVQFFDLLMRAFQPLWNEPAAEAALRAELIGRRIDDHQTLQRSLAFGAAIPVLLGRPSPARIERAHRRLDAADALARTRDIPLGHELVVLNRSLLWLATNMARARRSVESAIAAFARRGMANSFDGGIARVYHLIVIAISGADDALATIARALRAEDLNLISRSMFLSYHARLLSRRGEVAEASASLGRQREILAGVPSSRQHFHHAQAHTSVLVAEGRFAEAAATWDEDERAARATGAWDLAFDRSFWIAAQLDAAIGLSRERALAAPYRARARRAAAWLAKDGVFDCGCIGHRALALLDAGAGRRRAAEDALRHALTLSADNTSPYHRWQCLEAARDLGLITREQEEEAAELQAAGRFALPAGWND